MIYIHSGSGVLIMYGAPEAISVYFAFLAQVALIKSCDAPESNNIVMGRSLRKNVPASTSSPPWWCNWRGQTVVLGPSDGPSAGSPRALEYAVSCPTWLRGSPW
jgi:hypothetical protein